MFVLTYFCCGGQQATQRLYGELNHPQIDFTPHYGIDRNIGIETGITLSPSSPGEYDNPGIVTSRFVPKYTGGPGVGTDGFFSSCHMLLVVPMHQSLPMVQFTSSVFTPRQGISSGRETGLVDGFTPGTIFGGPGQVTFKGIAPSRPIQVFGYYGDDKDPGIWSYFDYSFSGRNRNQISQRLCRCWNCILLWKHIPISLQHSEKLEQENSSSSLLYTKEEPSIYVGSGTLTASGTTDAPKYLPDSRQYSSIHSF